MIMHIPSSTDIKNKLEMGTNIVNVLFRGGSKRGLHSATLRQKIVKSAACGFESYNSAAAASSR